MKRENKVINILRAINHYLIFFLLVAFVCTCCMMLFISVMSSSLNINLTESNIKTAAKLTFGNVVLISLIFTIIDAVRRRITVDGPVNRITMAAEKIIQGDFSIRIEPQSKFATDEKFNEIITCFNKMASELSSVETLRTDFIANVSHEMKTPLAIIQNYGTLLQSSSLLEEQRIEYAKGITNSSKRLADMITNILKLNKLENQQIYTQAIEYDLSEQLCQCLLQYEEVWEKSSIEIETNITENIRIKADSELLSLVWNNLFSNAFKFTNPGGTVSIHLTATEQYAIVKVKDTGCGMPPQVGAHIFEKFYQGDVSHSVSGNGLGLALVKRVIDIIHGDIKVESSVGKGSTFTVRIRRS